MKSPPAARTRAGGPPRPDGAPGSRWAPFRDPSGGGTGTGRSASGRARSPGELAAQGAGVAAKLLESITCPHLAPQSVDVEFSSHGLTLPIAICVPRCAQALDNLWTPRGTRGGGETACLFSASTARRSRAPVSRPLTAPNAGPSRIGDMATAPRGSDRDRRVARFGTDVSPRRILI